ncbi:MAG: DUF370 domain-containing protein [Clostridia bacterium]|nr:DUF370 domain-containing protein [Clostridia bacterium]
MFLHVGNGKSIRKKDIVGIFDLDTATVSGITKSYITKAEKNGILTYPNSDLPRSFVLLSSDQQKETVILSRISTRGLVLRSDGGVISEESDSDESRD